MLSSCESSEKVIKDKSLESFTLKRTVSGVTLYEADPVYMIEKDGTLYKVTDENGAVRFFRDFGSVTYEYTTEEIIEEDDEETVTTTEAIVTTTTEEEVTTTEDSSDVTTTVEENAEEETPEETPAKEKVNYTKSTKADKELSQIVEELSGLSKGMVTSVSGNEYSLNTLKQNALISALIEGIDLDSKTELKAAYDKGLIEATEAKITILNKMVESLVVKFNYASQDVTVKVEFSNVASTKVNVVAESYVDKAYASYISDKAPVVTLNFKGYGKVKVQLFVDDTILQSNAVKYFIYLIKKSFYSKAKVDVAPTTDAILFGASSKKLDKTISTSTIHTVKNVRGTLSLVFKDADDASTPQLVLNLSDNSATYESKGYAPVAGVIEGFEVLDELSGVEDYSKISVSVSIKYNGYKYVAPEFAS